MRHMCYKRKVSRPFIKKIPAYLFSFLSTLCMMCAGFPALAHSGPPIPIIMQQVRGPYQISVWADADVGEADFYIGLEPAKDMTHLNPTSVEIGVQPISKRLPEKRYQAKRQSNPKAIIYIAQVPFDKQEMWRVRVILHDAAGINEVVAQVEATPDDLGPFSLIMYTLPFIAIGLIWAIAAHQSRQRQVATTK